MSAKSNLYKLLVSENYALRRQIYEMSQDTIMLKRNSILMNKFIMSIYDFSGDAPTFAACINISTYDESGNVLSCVKSDLSGNFTPCEHFDSSNNLIPCVLPPMLPSSSDLTQDKCLPYDYPYDYGYHDYPYYGYPYDYGYGYPYSHLLNDYNDRSIESAEPEHVPIEQHTKDPFDYGGHYRYRHRHHHPYHPHHPYHHRRWRDVQNQEPIKPYPLPPQPYPPQPYPPPIPPNKGLFPYNHVRDKNPNDTHIHVYPHASTHK